MRESLAIIRSPRSRADVISHAYYIAEHSSLNASDNFLASVETAYKRLAGMPGIGAPRDYGSAFPDLRMSRVPKFAAYLIFYQATEHELIIRRVLHGSQDIEQIFHTDEL